MDDLYKILGIEKGASKDEVKKAFRHKAKRAHPDRKGGDHATMAAVNKAYEVLSDEAKRKQYDQTGDANGKQPSIEEMALQSLAKAFDDLLSEEAPPCNIVATITAGIKDAMGRYEFEVAKIETYISKLDKKSKTVSKKTGDSHNLWADVVTKRRQRYELALEMAKRNMEVGKKAIEILAEYEGTSPPTKAAKPFTGGTFSSGDWTKA